MTKLIRYLIRDFLRDFLRDVLRDFLRDFLRVIYYILHVISLIHFCGMEDCEVVWIAPWKGTLTSPSFNCVF